MSISNFSLRNKYIARQIGKKNIENHRLEETVVMYRQILRTKIKRTYDNQ